MKRKTVVLLQTAQHPLSGRRSSFKIKQTNTFFPKANLLNRISQLSPEKITRSSSTKLSSRLGRSQVQSNQLDPFSSVNQKSQIQQLKVSESKTSKKALGAVKAFATNLFNNHKSQNQTRISIVTSMKHQNTGLDDISFFAVFEGHNGNECATFLRDNLHLYIASDKSFPQDIAKAMQDGIKLVEEQWIKFAKKTLCDAGSSFVVAIVKEQTIYIANIGDCRGLASLNLGQQSTNLTTDHTAHNQSQFNRILKKGGSISKQKDGEKIDFFLLPGYKRTTRSIGDCYYKSKHPGILPSDPTITKRKINPCMDFVLLGTHRLFGFTNVKQVVRNLWRESINDESENIHAKAGQLVKYLLENTSKETNSLGAILLVFEGYEKTFASSEAQNVPNFGQ